MAEQTGIAWAKSTWNPWIGCAEVSPGCDNCYARALDARHKYGGATHWGIGVPRYRTKQWHVPLQWNKKAAETGERWTVFLSLCDPFDNEVPMIWRHDLWKLIINTPHLTWLLLTKRIGNVAKMWPVMLESPPPNVWLGSSVVNQEEADRDIQKLLATPSAKRFVSYEPGLGLVDFCALDIGDGIRLDALRGVHFGPADAMIARKPPHFHNLRSTVDWVIIGGESSQGGVRARPFNVEWARSVIAQCKAAGVPVLMKQLGSNPFDSADQDTNRLVKLIKDRAGADPAEWPEDLRVQEFPQ